MPYWGDDVDQCDFAFDSVGAVIYLIIERMNKDVDKVLEKSYPEQSMVAYLTCLRLIGERFPKNLSVHFRKKHLKDVKSAFENWYDKVSDKLPSHLRADILRKAQEEFALFEERILKQHEG